MAWTNLFTINTTDLTSYEDTEKHSVNKADVFDAWTDGNWIEHRNLSRTRISGTVVLKFKSPTEYSTFLGLLTSERTSDGYYPVTVYCSNTGTSETINAFLDVVSETKWDVTAPLKHQTVTLQITQR